MGDVAVDKTNSLKIEGQNLPDNSDNVSVSSKASEGGGSIKSGIPKPSGIKPPSGSRIGRLCTGQVPKPSLPPATPPKNGSEESLRKLTEEYGRHRLADVKEENEDDMALTSASPARRNRYSSLGSAASSSMDYLWDLHPRRLSEAGLSRHSDNSTILTEDTDSFIIGQRVWVGGTKPGHIAYIGETQFAPGEWAGIALDHPIGKNDGSVGGIRYFQCEPKKGIFSRLTRLTRYPLDGETGGAGDCLTSTPLNGTRNSVSPTGSTSPFKSPPSLTTSNTSISSALVDFKLGDRVIIKSSQGSKIGTLRFMGCTEFAGGEWCGVELDEPRGKNDGSVGGKRYFDCRPNFGLFAPVSKVSKSPSSRKPGGCVIHSGPGIPPSGFRRANSKESITSNVSITSAASGVRRVRLGVTSLTTPQKASPKSTATPIPTRTALQEVLKEKQQHIEQLLKERDLERAELARAASQADEVEQKYTSLKQEYDLYRDETEKKLQQHLNILDELKRDRSELISNLEDEKRKVEDLQFRYEEAEISKSDLEISDESNQSRIKELETEVESTRQRIEVLEADSNKLFEAEESLLRLREENEALKYEIEVAAKKILSLEAEGTTSKDSEHSLQKETIDLKEVIKERDDIIEKFKNDITQVSEQFEATRNNFVKELEDYKKKLEESNKENTNKELLLGQLKEDLIKVQNTLVEKSKDLESSNATSKEIEDKMGKEINRLKMELSSKTHDIEENRDVISKKDDEIKRLISQMENMKGNLESKNLDFDQYKETLKEIENNLRKELEESRNTVTAKITELEEIKKVAVLALTQKESELKDANKIIQNYKEELEKMSSSLNQIKEESANSKEEIKNAFQLKIKESEENILKLNTELQSKNTELVKLSANAGQLENEISLKAEDISRLQNELESSRKRYQEENTSLVKSNEELTKLQLNLGDLERKLKIADEKNSELTKNKAKLEGEIQMLIGSSGDFSTKLEELTQELRAKENVIETVKSEFTTKVQELERSKQEIELQYNNFVQKSAKDLKEYDEKIGKEIAEKNGLTQDIEKLSSESQKTIETLNVKLSEYQNYLQEKDQLLKKLQSEATETQDKLRLDVEKKSKEFSDSLSELQRKVVEISKENEEVKTELSRKTVEMIEYESKFNKEIELTKQNEHNSKMAYEEKIKALELELNEKQKEYEKLLKSSQNEISEKILDIEAKNKDFGNERQKLIEENKRIKTQLEDMVKLSQDENENIKKTLEMRLKENAKANEEMVMKCKDLNEELERKTKIINEMQANIKVTEENLQEVVKTTTELEMKTKDREKKLQEIVVEKDKIIEELQAKLKILLKNESDFQISMENLQRQETSLKSDLEHQLNKLTDELGVKSVALQKVEEELLNMKQQTASKDTLSNEKDSEITQLKSELQVNHQFVEKLQKENQDLQKQGEDVAKALSETKIYTSKLNEEISKLNEELKTSGKIVIDLNHSTNLYTTILQMLNLSEKQKIELVDKLNDDIKTECDEESYAKLCKLVDGIKINSEISEEAKQLKETQGDLLKYKKMYVEAEDKVTRKDAEISLLKKDYEALSKSITATKPKVDNPTTSSMVNNNPSSNEQLLEEKIFAESQVAFLNSIIVDMQKKNDEQKARIEILEMGYSPAAAQELGLLGLVDRRMPAPRMYCDICEEFDLHETEDCPQQANDDPPPREGPKKEKPAPRPYCDICEEFGHSTENCQDDQTF